MKRGASICTMKEGENGKKQISRVYIENTLPTAENVATSVLFVLDWRQRHFFLDRWRPTCEALTASKEHQSTRAPRR
jgi:hypothetical protein